MKDLNAEHILIIVCSLVVLSYLFTIISRYIRVPAVLLLLFAGIGFREICNYYGILINFPQIAIQSLGVVGLIIIVLEAGLDLRLGKEKNNLIRGSFLSALMILIISSAAVTAVLYYWLHEPLQRCLVYAIPLSIMSSSIVIPSIHHLTPAKKDFLIYEASFSDILGILFFNYFIADETFTPLSIALFAGNLFVAIVLSLVLSLLLFVILARTILNIKFFLIFSLLILIYSTGKLLHLPSLLLILIFGLMINNSEKINNKFFQRLVPRPVVEPVLHLMHSITAESSFLIRTFFFFLFGFSISLHFLTENEVLLAGSLIVASLFVIRFLYLRFFLHTNVLPEAFFIPRGLITIVLFYKIPDNLKLQTFPEGILFFIILTTSIIMTLGMILYHKKPEEVIEDPQFSERNDL
jgi:Kef-type K+ transport system membrane component KefB